MKYTEHKLYLIENFTVHFFFYSAFLLQQSDSNIMRNHACVLAFDRRKKSLFPLVGIEVRVCDEKIKFSGIFKLCFFN